MSRNERLPTVQEPKTASLYRLYVHFLSIGTMNKVTTIVIAIGFVSYVLDFVLWMNFLSIVAILSTIIGMVVAIVSQSEGNYLNLEQMIKEDFRRQKGPEIDDVDYDKTSKKVTLRLKFSRRMSEFKIRCITDIGQMYSKYLWKYKTTIEEIQIIAYSNQGDYLGEGMIRGEWARQYSDGSLSQELYNKKMLDSLSTGPAAKWGV